MAHKSDADRDRYYEVLRRMTPEQRLKKAFELSDLTKRLLRQGILERFPELSDAERHQIFLNRLAECHNRNY